MGEGVEGGLGWGARELIDRQLQVAELENGASTLGNLS